MMKIAFLVLLAMVAVASASLCCSPKGNIGPAEKATDSKLTQTPKTTYQVPRTQVLILKVAKDEDHSLILDWKEGKGLDWKFVSMQGTVMKDVWAHKSLVLRHSSLLQMICESLAQRGTKKNSYVMNYPVPIIESLVNLMYEHKAVINTSDYKTIMAAAKTIQIDGLIGTSSQKK